MNILKIKIFNNNTHINFDFFFLFLRAELMKKRENKILHYKFTKNLI